MNLQTNDISVNHKFERRISIYPAAFINDRLYANTLRSDYPMAVPTENADPFHNVDVGWQVLSYKKVMNASSVLDDAHMPQLAADEYMASWWSAKTGNPGEWLSMDLGDVYTVTAVQVNFADQGVGTDKYGRNLHYGYRYALEYSVDGLHWEMLVDRSENTKDMPHDYVQLESDVQIRYLKLTNRGEIPAGGLFSVSELRVFGPGHGAKPEKAPAFTAVRANDTRDMHVTIVPVPDAQGYYIRFGIAQDELYTHYQVMADSLTDTPVTIGFLKRGTEYLVTVDAYNEAGVTVGTQIVRC